MNSQVFQRPHSLYASSGFPPAYLKDVAPPLPGTRGTIRERHIQFPRHETDHTVEEARRQPTMKLLIDSSQESAGNVSRLTFDPAYPKAPGASNLSPFSNYHTSSSSLISHPDRPSPCRSISSDRLEKSYHNMNPTHRRSIQPGGFDFPSYPTFAAPRPRPRPNGNTPAARPYSSVTLGGRPLSSAFGDDNRIVTGYLASALPLSARPPPLPTRPRQTMSIEQLDQRHRLALQRLQEPANAYVARHTGSNGTSPLSSQMSSSRNSSPPASAHRTNRREKPRTLIVLDQDQGQTRSETSTRPSKKNKSSNTRQSDRSKSHIPVLILSGESGSDATGRNPESDSDSDVPLAQLRLRTKSSIATVCTSRSSSNSQRITRHARSHPSLSQFGHPLRSVSTVPSNHYGSMVNNRSSTLGPPIGNVTSAVSSQKQRNRSSAWLNY
ncbi:hypothetical protein DFH28DRAFT_1096072 [Melampsora americana]|nr:hypothetical protein DFH28DRAFT_1096072 [Melampsora americana]